jgi:hypothetical protein
VQLCSYRLARLVANESVLAVVTISNCALSAVVAATVGLVLAYVSIWVALDPPLPVVEMAQGLGSDGSITGLASYVICRSHSNAWPQAIIITEV